MGKLVDIPLNQKRLLSVEEFQLYSSIGRNNAFKLVNEIGCYIKVGKRVLVDRKAFDNWCDKQTSVVN